MQKKQTNTKNLKHVKLELYNMDIQAVFRLQGILFEFVTFDSDCVWPRRFAGFDECYYPTKGNLDIELATCTISNNSRKLV